MGHVSLLPGQTVLEPAYQAPGTAEEFWARDWLYVLKLTCALLKNSQEAQDVAADIFEKLLVRWVPGMYEPGTVSVHTQRRVTWRAFLSRQVALYVRGKGEQVGRRLYREPLLCDAPAGDGSSRWVEMFGGQVWDDYPSLSDSEFVLQVREQLASLPAYEGVSLLAMFEEILSLVKDGEKITVAHLRRQFGSQAPHAYARLREALMPSQEPVTIEVAGIELTPDEVREAARVLREAKGNQVRSVFAAAGHKLAAAGTKWYLPFAAEEIAKFPELDIPKGTHKDGHPGRVKGALIHRLERLTGLAVVPCPEPDQVPPVPEETFQPAEVLESRLFRLGASAADVDAILELARQAFGAA